MPVGTTPLVTFTGVTVNALPLQIAAVMAVIADLGLTVIVTVNGVPVQVPDNGVTVYTAVCDVLDGFVNV